MKFPTHFIAAGTDFTTMQQDVAAPTIMRYLDHINHSIHIARID